MLLSIPIYRDVITLLGLYCCIAPVRHAASGHLVGSYWTIDCERSNRETLCQRPGRRRQCLIPNVQIGIMSSSEAQGSILQFHHAEGGILNFVDSIPFFYNCS
ncbi:hypothetical protein F4679DRAFT_558312 [Xylaria curta]|nr:hypothetical protein F4679DRAFT_558312 [Xylaria curta]